MFSYAATGVATIVTQQPMGATVAPAPSRGVPRQVRAERDLRKVQQALISSSARFSSLNKEIIYSNLFLLCALQSTFAEVSARRVEIMQQQRKVRKSKNQTELNKP